ncbi:UNVERIFIED_CONTAM: hypothetical protein K2H54_051006 [Gekko kuhli]
MLAMARRPLRNLRRKVSRGSNMLGLRRSWPWQGGHFETSGGKIAAGAIMWGVGWASGEAGCGKEATSKPPEETVARRPLRNLRRKVSRGSNYVGRLLGLRRCWPWQGGHFETSGGKLAAGAIMWDVCWASGDAGRGKEATSKPPEKTVARRPLRNLRRKDSRGSNYVGRWLGLRRSWLWQGGHFETSGGKLAVGAIGWASGEAGRGKEETSPQEQLPGPPAKLAVARRPLRNLRRKVSRGSNWLGLRRSWPWQGGHFETSGGKIAAGAIMWGVGWASGEAGRGKEETSPQEQLPGPPAKLAVARRPLRNLRRKDSRGSNYVGRWLGLRRSWLWQGGHFETSGEKLAAGAIGWASGEAGAKRNVQKKRRRRKASFWGRGNADEHGSHLTCKLCPSPHQHRQADPASPTKPTRSG